MRISKKGGILDMNLGEKIFKLRKEKGLTQESLAEQLGTTRQAISKWENNQGFPEVEKLLQLSNIFEVSLDFLLKGEETALSSSERGYYVSKEMANAYLAKEKKLSVYISLTFLFISFAGIPYTLFPKESVVSYLGMTFCAVMGIIFFVIGIFHEDEKYKILKREPLLFDYEYLKEIKAEYEEKKKKYKVIGTLSMILFLSGLIFLGINVTKWKEYHSLVFLGFGIGLSGFVYSANITEAYELLANNEKHSGSLLFKIKRKIKEKIENM